MQIRADLRDFGSLDPNVSNQVPEQGGHGHDRAALKQDTSFVVGTF